MPAMRFLSTVFLLMLAGTCADPATLHAQRVHWEPSHGTLGIDKLEQLTLVFENCAPTEEVNLPAIDGLEIVGRSYSEQRINTSMQVFLTYGVQATRRGQVVIPAFDVRTNRGTLAVGEVRFEVGDAAVGTTGLPINELINGYIRPSRQTVWAGEVFDIEYIVLGSPRYSWQLTSLPDWKPAGLVIEPWSEPERVQSKNGDQTREGVRFRTRAMALQAGTLKLDPIKQNIRIQTGERTGFLSQPRFEAFTIGSDAPELTVRALPQPAPDGFSGVVGTFQLESKIVPETASVGAPITWTLALRGNGNWPTNPALPEREVVDDFQVVQPQPRQTMDDGRLFSGSLTEDAVLVPTRAGSYTLGPVKFSYFDTTSGSYRDASIAPVKVTITPAVAPANVAPPPGPSDSTTSGPSVAGTETGRPATLPDDLIAPTPLPHDPLPIGRDAWVPGATSSIWWWLVALLPPTGTWLALAWWHMLRSDDARRRLAVRDELQRMLAACATNMSAEHLLHWRALTATLWDVARAAPTIDDFSRALATPKVSGRTEEWLALWREAEATLFSARTQLPNDWTTRAMQAARDVRVKRSSPLLPLRVRHWSPRGVLTLIVVLAVTISARAAEDAPTRAYREGDFASAKLGWQARLVHEPRDWAAHNNLALACAQQDDWPNAAAHWTAAFLLAPREPTIRANLRLALSRLDGIDPELRRLVEGSTLDRAVTVLSPGEWQTLFFSGAVMLGAGAIILIVSLYRRPSRVWNVTGIALLAAGGLGSIAGISGIKLYGPLADPTAGLVVTAGALHSIPTDLVEHQQSSPISPGAVVVVRRSFLGWDRVEATRAATGWIRRERVVPFFRAPEKSEAPPAAASL